MSNLMSSISRREMLKCTLGAGLATLSLPSFTHSVDAQSVDAGASIFVRNSNKFGPDGKVRRFAGNTIICPLPKESVIFRELARVHNHFIEQSFAHRLAILPPSSYHSTIFSGANDQERQAHVWPDDIPLNTPIEECNRLLEDRLRKTRFAVSLPLRFRIDSDPKTLALDRSTSSIRLIPFDEAENRKVRELRDKLSEVLKIRSADHDNYHFHITLGYWVQPVTPVELKDYHRTLSAALAQLTSEIHSVDLQAPQYCTFEDMLAYSPREPLNLIPTGRSARI